MVFIFFVLKSTLVEFPVNISQIEDECPWIYIKSGNSFCFFEQYSACRQNSCEKQGFAELARELSEEFKPQGLLVSAAPIIMMI